MSIEDWLYLITASGLIVFALVWGILCIKEANHIIKKCKKVQEGLKSQLKEPPEVANEV